MLNWLKGGPSTAYTSEDAISVSAKNDHEPRNINTNTILPDEDAFTDTSSGEEGNRLISSAVVTFKQKMNSD